MPLRRDPPGRDRPLPRVEAPRPKSKPRMGRAATDAKLAEERATVLSRNAVSRETAESLDRYVELLREWQRHINLVSPATVPEVWTRHLEDGLVLGRLARGVTRWADIGSGAGLPGLVLAILMRERDGGHVDLVESNGKKAAFLRAVVRELDLPAEVHARRIEDCASVIGAADGISARALASLPDLLDLVAPLAPEATLWFLKGRSHEEEIADAAALWRFDMVKHSLDTEEGAVLLEITTPRRSGEG